MTSAGPFQGTVAQQEVDSILTRGDFEGSMNCWCFSSLAILILAMVGCGGTTPASPSAASSKANELLESGNSSLARGEFQRAFDEFNRAVELQANSARARERRAAAFAQMKKYKQALNDCNEAVRIDPKFAAAYFARGQVHKCLGEPQKALADFTQAIDYGLERVDILVARAGVYCSLATATRNADEAANYREKALRDFDRAIQLDSRQIGCRLQRAAIHLDRHDFVGAVADCDAALEADPKSAAAYVARARGRFGSGETDKALVDCDAAIRLDENLIDAYAVRAEARTEKASEMRTLSEVAECGQAVDDCQRTIELVKKLESANKSPMDAADIKRIKTLHGLAHEHRGVIYHSLGAAKKATAEYEKAISLVPNLVSALLRRAETRSNMEDSVGALNDCNTAIDIDRTRPDAYCSRGTAYAYKPDYPKAIENFTQAVTLDRKCAKAWAGRAAVYSAMASEEFENWQKALGKTEKEACLARTSEYLEKCIADATKAIEANPHLAKAYLTRGVSYAKRLDMNNSLNAKQQDMNNALVDFSSAIREDPKLIAAYYYRGRVCIIARQPRLLDQAIKDFEEASKLAPNNARFCDCLLQCWHAKGDPIMEAQYRKKLQEIIDLHRQERASEIGAEDFKPRLKPQTDLRPDITDLDPLEIAKKSLEKKLDASAER
jgi:tetratricopeptide (TPR) repeat protein